MEYRELGRTGWKISTISLGTWAMGSLWGAVDRRESMAALNRALDLGVNFFDTADAYGSEPLLGQLRRQRHEPFYIATKMGMGVNPDPRGYNRRNLTIFVENSLRNLGTETIDLMQLHCPPIEAYNAEVFGILDELVKQGKILHYGVSVERIDEAKAAIQFPGVQSVMLIFNMFRLRPIEDFFPEAQQRQVGIIARVPMASGLLTGKMTWKTTFEADDHRNFNRQGRAFDRGETFSGVDFDKGLEAVEELRKLVPAGTTMAQMALRWILMFEAVTCAVPGAKRPEQVEDTLRAADLPPLSKATMDKISEIYDRRIRADVHALW
ncbi:MAG: aldo/keto reductase [Anaerolineales bacterium]|jgi:aryl-alcohol dehydrogenase-like predicted oxidoreductase